MNTTTITKMQRELVAVTEERDRLAAELQKLRDQEPIGYLSAECLPSASYGFFVKVEKWETQTNVPVYVSPVAAPAVPTDEQIHAAYRVALGQSIRERDMPEIRKFAIALLQSVDHSEKALEMVTPEFRTSAKDSEV